MKITYLNGNRLYYAFIAGGNAVIQDRDYLNKINVFPVPDADTGTNLASTMRSIAERAVAHSSIKKTLQSIEDAAFEGARGNSGIIFAQFIHGISREIKAEMKISTQAFGESVRRAVHYAYKSIVSPVEGTMLTVIRDWAEAVYKQRTRTNDFVELLSHSLHVAKQSLKDTPKKLSVLAKAGVVDAGAKGFVDFLEGVTHFIRQGRLKSILAPSLEWTAPVETAPAERSSVDLRYCSEALIVGRNIDMDKLRDHVRGFGNSAIIAGTEDKARIHIHTDHPSELHMGLLKYGDIVQIKADDMVKQYEVSHNRKWPIALVTDSACDIPESLIEHHQVHVIPVTLSFGDSLFLDKVTITPDQFYTMLKTSRNHPQTSIPPLKTVQNLYSFLASHYESLLVINLSDKLSGMHKLCQQAAAVISGKKIDLIDSKHLSVGQGLLVMRIAQAIEEGKVHEEIVFLAQDWVRKTKLLVDIQTLKYMVRSGRVSPLKGLLAKMLNLKPIITLDEEGRSAAEGKSFSRQTNMKKIIRKIIELADKGPIWNYAIVHAQNRPRADRYAESLTETLGKGPAFILDTAPVIGVHSGIGAVGISLMYE